MSSVLFDVGDEQRLEREEKLTEQLPRQSIIDRPSDSMMMDVSREADEFTDDEPENPFDIMLDGLLDVLQRSLNE